MTLDRKIRKDAFYLYKAYWSEEAFVHLCQKRYAQRTGEQTNIKVYSNQGCVSLYVNGEFFQTLEGEKVFEFRGIPLGEYTMVTARAGEETDSMTIIKTEEPVEAYILVDDEDDGEGVENWFHVEDYKDVTTLEIKEGYFSVKDTVGEILENEEAGNSMIQALAAASGMKLKKSMLGMIKDMSVEKMGTMSGMGEKPSFMIAINEVLNKIPK